MKPLARRIQNMTDSTHKTFRAYIHDHFRLHYIFVARDGATYYVKAKITANPLFGDEVQVPLKNELPDFLALGFRSQTKCPNVNPAIVKNVWAHNDPEAGRGAKLLAELKEGWRALMEKASQVGVADVGGYSVVNSLGAQRRREIHRS
jgi:hypothetical protein